MLRFQRYFRWSFVLFLLVAGTTLYGQSASLSVSITATPNPVGPNTDITYTINVGNEGPAPSDNAQLLFTAPPTTGFQSFTTPAGWSCNPPSIGTTNTVITCSMASFGPGGEVFTAVMRVDPTEPNGATLVGNATVSQTNTDPDPDDNSFDASVTVQWQADLSVSKSAPSTVIAGDTFDYSITVENLGPDGAVDATMTDTLGANLTYVSITQPAGWTCGESLGVITCTNPSFPNATTATFTLTVTVAPISGITVTNDVSVSTTSADNVLPNNDDSVSSDVIPSANLSVTKVGPATIEPDNDITYTIEITNAGPSTADNVTLSDTITMPFVSLASPGAWSCATPAVGTTGTVTCTTPTLASAAIATFTLVLNVPAGTSGGTVLSNTATASTVNDPDTSDNSATATTDVPPSADLSVTKVGPTTAVEGEAVVYTITVRNDGYDDAANATLTDNLPAPFLSLTAAAGWSCVTPAVGATGAITCTNASFASGATAVFTLSVIAPTAPATVTNTASITSDTPDPDGGDTSSTASTTINAAIAEVPTLSPWMLVLFAAMLGWIAMKR